MLLICQNATTWLCRARISTYYVLYSKTYSTFGGLVLVPRWFPTKLPYWTSSWWRHDTENHSAFAGPLWVNPSVTGGFYHKGAGDGTFGVSLLLANHELPRYHDGNDKTFAVVRSYSSPSGGCLNTNMSSYQYRYPRVKDKTVSRPSYV